MWSLSEVFAENADKARLVTALISVLSALAVIYVNHLLAHRRSRMELNSKKMEDLHSAITEFANAGWKYMHELVGPNERTLVTSSAYDEAYRKCEMLASIYADEISKEIEAMHEIVILILIKGRGNEDLLSFPGKLQAFIRIKSNALGKIASKARKLV